MSGWHYEIEFSGEEMIDDRSGLPHDHSYFLSSMNRVGYDEDQVVGAISRWDVLPAAEAPGTFMADVQPFPGPYKITDEEGLYVARTDWSGFDGHFGIVPAVETIDKLRELAAGANTDVESFARADMKDMVQSGGKVRFGYTEMGNRIDGLALVEQDGAMAGRPAAQVTSMKTREAPEGALSTMHVVESVMQGAGHAALQIIALRNRGMIPVVSHMQKVEVAGDVRAGDTLISHTTLTGINKTAGVAKIEIARKRNGVIVDIGHIEEVGFSGLKRQRIGLPGLPAEES